MARPTKAVPQVDAGNEPVVPAEASHLKEGSLNLKQSESVRKGLSKATKRHYSLLKLKAVNLDWSRK